MEIMEECIPRKILPPRRRNLPWLSKGTVQSMRRRNNLFKRAKRSGNHQDYVKYCQARNKVVSQLRSAKAAYFRKLNSANPKQFWKSVKYLNKASSSIPVLTHNNRTFTSNEDKANILNSFFSSCFNDSLPPLPLQECSGPASHCNPNILCSEEGLWICYSLSTLPRLADRMAYLRVCSEQLLLRSLPQSQNCSIFPSN